MSATRLSTLPIGHSLGEGRYQVITKLGRGSYGSVYLAHDLRLGERRVAIKELLDPSPESRELFQREALLLASLNHPGLVRVSHFFSGERSHYLVMDYIEGRDLREIAREAEATRQPLPLEQVLDWTTQICEVVAYLHRRTPPIVHRDIKPANIRLNEEGRAILVDFGIAKVGPKTTTVVMARAVSIGFSPPEQYEGGGGTDTRSDVYALGATLYCLLTLKVPPDGYERILRRTPLARPAQFNSAVSPALDEIVLKAMSVDGVHRYQDAGEMLKALKSSTTPLILTPEPAGVGAAPAASGVRCWRCGHLCRPGARFCPGCGATLESSALAVPAALLCCSACGAESRPTARFCSRCGTRMDVQRLTPPLHEANEYVSRGDHHARAGRWAQAVDDYEQAMQLGLREPSLHINLGQCYLQLDRLDDAIDIFEAAVRQYPRDAAVHAQLASAYLEAGKTLPGIQMLDQACRLTPDDEALALQLAQTCFNADQLLQAEQVLTDWLRRQPQRPEWPFWLGMIELKRGQADRALKHFQQTVTLAPEHTMAYYFIGEIYVGLKKWPEAAAAYQRCVEVDPTDADPYLKLGQCYLALNRPADAAAALRSALQIDPTNEMVRTLAEQAPGLCEFGL